MESQSNPTNHNPVTDYEQQHAMLQWLNRNRHQLLAAYKNQYIAFNSKGMIAHSENLKEVIAQAKASQEKYLLYLVPKRSASIQILPIYFRSVVRHEWLPNYSVTLRHQQQEITVAMLVDSGAEVSLITNKLGTDLGYALADSESTLLAETIGGTVEYVLRNVEMTIDNHSFIAPVAWLQTDTGGEQLLLGREMVFDRFNVEFRQAEVRGNDYAIYQKLTFETLGLVLGIGLEEIISNSRSSHPYSFELVFQYLQGRKVSKVGGEHNRVDILGTQENGRKIRERTILLNWGIHLF